MIPSPCGRISSTALPPSTFGYPLLFSDKIHFFSSSGLKFAAGMLSESRSGQ